MNLLAFWNDLNDNIPMMQTVFILGFLLLAAVAEYLFQRSKRPKVKSDCKKFAEGIGYDRE